MGWYYTYGASKASIIAELTRDDTHQRTLAKAIRGNVLWVVHEITAAFVAGSSTFEEGTRYIACYLLHGNRGEWGYKPIDEAAGPCYYTCPRKYLDMVPAVNIAWRKQVQEYHRRAE